MTEIEKQFIKIIKSELEIYFDEFDKDNKNYLSTDDAKLFCNKVLSQVDINFIFKRYQLDEDKDGKIFLDQFVIIY